MGKVVGRQPCFHSNPWEPDTDQVETVVPINRLVIFETNEYSHGFHSVNDSIPDNTSRKSFAIYSLHQR